MGKNGGYKPPATRQQRRLLARIVYVLDHMEERKDYEPVTCDYHDQLEAAALRRREVEIEFAQQGVAQRERGKIADVFAREGAEFVRFAADNGEVEIRLDEIIAFREL